MAEDFPSGLTDSGSGAEIASYQLAEEIGRGGMAVVYRARDVRLDRWVALKVLAPEFARDEAFRQRFIRESRAAAAVDHPNIIPIFDAGEADGVLFIAMRYVSGHDVHSLLHRSGPLPAARAIGIITQVAAALDAAHACGLVHRDVKPANMLLGGPVENSRGDHVYLSDFGISKAAHATTSLTLTGQVLGTLNYLAPEQVEGAAVDGRADEYALACASFEMLAGSPPFLRDENLAVMWAQVSAPPPPLTQHRPDLPAAADRVMAKALAKSPAARYQTCLAFATALQEACGPADTPVPNGTVAASPVRLAAPPTAADGAAPRAPFPVSPFPVSPFPVSPFPVSPVPVSPTADAIPELALTPPPGADLAESLTPGYGGALPAPGTRPVAGFPAGGVPAPGARPRPARRRRPLIALAGLLVVLAAAAFAVSRGGSLFRSAATGKSPAVDAAARARPLGPAGTVRSYYAAITARDYARAWRLGDNGAMEPGGSFPAFEAGYRTTQRDVITSIGASGPVVKARFTAIQTDGAVKYFQGTYVVQDGVIVKFAVTQTG